MRCSSVEEIYEEALETADRIYLTILHEKIIGDTYFPDYNDSDWLVTAQEDHTPDRKNPYLYTFLTLDRRG